MNGKHQGPRGAPHIFSNEEEKEICDLILEIGIGWSLSRSDIRTLVFQLADRLNKPWRNAAPNQTIAGRRWFKGFVMRHKERLSRRLTEGMSIVRILALNEHGW